MGILTVCELNTYLKNLLSNDKKLANLWVRGELSNCKRYTSGHLYFTLKDGFASIKCVMFRSRGSFLKFEPKDDMQVLVGGYVNLYERDGGCQLYVNNMQPDGIGAISLGLEQLKQKLADEGLFDNERKRTLPEYPQTIGVVTSSSGAAVRDIFKVSKRRHPGIQLILCPVQVQGDEAPCQIANAITLFNRLLLPPDILIIGRGGGSMEELWAFNTEQVVRAIAASAIPVVSAVGHETDYTLADFAADVRAATPSQAAELAVPDIAQTMRRISSLDQRMQNNIRKRVKYSRDEVDKMLTRPSFRRPKERLLRFRQEIDQLQLRVSSAMNRQVSKVKTDFELLLEKLQVLSPLSSLQRGYSITLNKDNTIVSTIQQVQAHADIVTVVRDGKIISRVTDTQLSQHGGDEKNVGKIN